MPIPSEVGRFAAKRLLLGSVADGALNNAPVVLLVP